jgi:hypothetical protein
MLLTGRAEARGLRPKEAMTQMTDLNANSFGHRL